MRLSCAYSNWLVGERLTLNAAKRPLLLGGVELFRESAERGFLELAEQVGAPVLTTVLAKGVFPMDHPQHMGIYIGDVSHTAIEKRVKQADLVLALGSQKTDLNLGATRWPIPGRATGRPPHGAGGGPGRRSSFRPPMSSPWSPTKTSNSACVACGRWVRWAATGQAARSWA